MGRRALIRAGKCLPETTTEVFVTFKRPLTNVFEDSGAKPANYLRFRLSPEVETALGAVGKLPGEAMVGEVEELLFRRRPSDEMAPYERLLGDAMRGDATLFAREDAVEAAWRIVDPVLGDATPVHEYDPGTWGPPEADALTADLGGWHNPSSPLVHARA